MPRELHLKPRQAAPVPPTTNTHPANSSRMFLSLLGLARRAKLAASRTGAEDEIVAPSILKSLLSALHYRDRSTVYHSRRVALISTGVASELGWDESGCRVLEIAGLLHDLGKLGIHDSILHKPGRLSADESEFVALNNRVGLTLMQACRIHFSVIDTIAQTMNVGDVVVHPDAQDQTNTALGARILAVADVYDSLTHDQAFRQHLEPDQAMQALVDSDRQLDRNVIAALRRWLNEGGQSLLADDEEARHLIDASAPVDEATIREAHSLCHACSYLHVLESLYDGYYVVDANLNIVVSSLGLNRLLPDGGLRVGERWSRTSIAAVDQAGNPLTDAAYPMYCVRRSNQPEVATLKVPLETGERLELELHAIPVLDENGKLAGAAEILRNLSQAKKDPVLYQELRQAASEDPLTGVANRGELDDCLAELHAEWAREGHEHPYSIIFLDIDHFKKINDTYEHATGDRVLVNLVQLLEDELYSGETVGRYGGEEFLIVCPTTDLEHAIKRAERIRRAIQNANLGDDLPFQVTASFGVAEVAPSDTAKSVLHRADQALFDAKRSGRNRTCFREPEDMQVETPEPTDGEQEELGHRHGEFAHTARIVVCEASDMVIYKLKGFVEDLDAKLLDVSSDLVGMQLGRKSMLGNKWGSVDKKQPIELVVSIGEEFQVGRSATKRLNMDVSITPIGRPPDSDTFHHRAATVLERLRSYLLAD